MRQALEPSVRGPIVARMPVGRRLNPAERARLIVEILASYREARRALRRESIEAAVERLRGGPAAAADRSTDREVPYEAWRLGRAVQRTLTLVPGDTRCLTRSLLLTQMLARRGIPAKLVIGTRAKPSFSAHAWVEQAGEPVLPAGEHSFGRLVEL
ncbi:MAG TPA: lasso peptide biosynthesis B2 protein [Solirubrobacteraceae bacterium]|nr:lasso peptide biosynthesis B2 protein [Solirubrobacteraceae bacterium]